MRVLAQHLATVKDWLVLIEYSFVIPHQHGWHASQEFAKIQSSDIFHGMKSALKRETLRRRVEKESVV